jgi:hypothetical protein
MSKKSQKSEEVIEKVEESVEATPQIVADPTLSRRFPKLEKKNESLKEEENTQPHGE